MNIALQEANLLRDARKENVIAPSLRVFDTIDLKVFDWAIDNFREQPYWLKDPQFAAPTQRYVEDVKPLKKHDPTDEDWLVELARICVPTGSIGYLKSIEQFIQDQQNNYFPTASEFWGVPFHNHPQLDDCIWFLRLDNYDGTQPPYIDRSAAGLNFRQALPGIGYYELPEWRDIWYPPHCSARFPNLIIPGGKMLRFFFYTPAVPLVNPDWFWEVAGRLRAVIQSALCREMDYNTRISSW